jgi:hypothetical protein
VKGVKEHRTDYRQLKRLGKKKKKIVVNMRVAWKKIK